MNGLGGVVWRVRGGDGAVAAQETRGPAAERGHDRGPRPACVEACVVGQDVEVGLGRHGRHGCVSPEMVWMVPGKMPDGVMG